MCNDALGADMAGRQADNGMQHGAKQCTVCGCGGGVGDWMGKLNRGCGAPANTVHRLLADCTYVSTAAAGGRAPSRRGQVGLHLKIQQAGDANQLCR
jgi:hypothetical protein